jgi:hypothetical protein
MGTSMMQRKATTGQVVMAAALLIGILLTAYGYFEQAKIELYVGLAVTAAGALTGALQVVLRRGE